MRYRSLGFALFLALGPARAGAQAAIDRALWLAGCWEARGTNRVVVEMWMPPMGDLMIGGSRTVIGLATREFEHLRIRARGDTLVYTAAPSGQVETDFRATHTSTDSLVFENPAHDFPQRIVYRRAGADSVVARVEGPGPNNTTRGFNIAMRRVDCTRRAPGPAMPTHGAHGGGPSADAVSGRQRPHATDADAALARRTPSASKRRESVREA